MDPVRLPPGQHNPETQVGATDVRAEGASPTRANRRRSNSAPDPRLLGVPAPREPEVYEIPYRLLCRLAGFHPEARVLGRLQVLVENGLRCPGGAKHFVISGAPEEAEDWDGSARALYEVMALTANRLVPADAGAADADDGELTPSPHLLVTPYHSHGTEAERTAYGRDLARKLPPRDRPEVAVYPFAPTGAPKARLAACIDYTVLETIAGTRLQQTFEAFISAVGFQAHYGGRPIMGVRDAPEAGLRSPAVQELWRAVANVCELTVVQPSETAEQWADLQCRLRDGTSRDGHILPNYESYALMHPPLCGKLGAAQIKELLVSQTALAEGWGILPALDHESNRMRVLTCVGRPERPTTLTRQRSTSVTTADSHAALPTTSQQPWPPAEPASPTKVLTSELEAHFGAMPTSRLDASKHVPQLAEDHGALFFEFWPEFKAQDPSLKAVAMMRAFLNSEPRAAVPSGLLVKLLEGQKQPEADRTRPYPATLGMIEALKRVSTLCPLFNPDPWPPGVTHKAWVEATLTAIRSTLAAIDEIEAWVETHQQAFQHDTEPYGWRWGAQAKMLLALVASVRHAYCDAACMAIGSGPDGIADAFLVSGMAAGNGQPAGFVAFLEGIFDPGSFPKSADRLRCRLEEQALTFALTALQRRLDCAGDAALPAVDVTLMARESFRPDTVVAILRSLDTAERLPQSTRLTQALAMIFVPEQEASTHRARFEGAAEELHAAAQNALQTSLSSGQLKGRVEAFLVSRPDLDAAVDTPIAADASAAQAAEAAAALVERVLSEFCCQQLICTAAVAEALRPDIWDQVISAVIARVYARHTAMHGLDAFENAETFHQWRATQLQRQQALPHQPTTRSKNTKLEGQRQVAQGLLRSYSTALSQLELLSLRAEAATGSLQGALKMEIVAKLLEVARVFNDIGRALEELKTVFRLMAAEAQLDPNGPFQRAKEAQRVKALAAGENAARATRP